MRSAEKLNRKMSKMDKAHLSVLFLGLTLSFFTRVGKFLSFPKMSEKK